MNYEVIIRTSVTKELADRIPYLQETALKWVQAKYPTVNFEGIRIIYTASARGSKYFRNTEQDLPPTIQICTRGKLLLYPMKRAGVVISSVWAGCDTQITSALIHELTHHAQYELGMSRGELETTKNEVSYLATARPDLYKVITAQK